jgi:adenine-specific DNA-methyltransferase
MTVEMAARELGARGSRAKAAGADPAGVPSSAAADVLASVSGWWAARAAAFGLSGPWTKVTAAVDAPAPLGLLERAKSPSVDTAALDGHSLGLAYVEALESGVRARHGRHYTPADLADRVWASTREAFGWGKAFRPLPGLVRDPAAGAGALLLPPLREHLAASHDTDPSLVLASLPQLVEGFDADPHAAWLGSVILAAELLPLLRAQPERMRRALPGLIRVGDGLADAIPARAVLMNPPYGRVRLAAPDRERFGHLISGHANLYGLFLGHALDTLDGDGVLTALTPTSFTAGRYSMALRGHLTARSALRSMTFVQNRNGVFSGVLQETCIATFVRGTRPRLTRISVANGTVRPIARVPVQRTSSPWVLPRRVEDAPVAAAAALLPCTLTDLGWRASTGPLVWNRRTDDLFARKGRDRYPVLWGADVSTGAVIKHQSRRALRWLATTSDRDRATMVQNEPAVLVQRTTAPEQTRRLVVADLSPDVLDGWGGGVVVENHVNVLRPVGEPAVPRVTLARVLATPTLDRVMRSIAGSVAVSAYELTALRFPSAQRVAAWGDLDDGALEAAVADAYRPVQS